MFYPARPFTLSFELFPPKTAAGEDAAVGQLAAIDGLSAGLRDLHLRRRRLDAGQDARNRRARCSSAFGVRVASHLTCVGSTVDQLRGYLREAQRADIDNIVALRGDPPQGRDGVQPVDRGPAYANELVALIRREFRSSASPWPAIPKRIGKRPSPEADLENLRRKVDAGGALRDHATVLRQRRFLPLPAAMRASWTSRVPIVPGILPVTNLAQIQRITSLCKAGCPKHCLQSSANKTMPVAVRCWRPLGRAAGARADRRRRAGRTFLCAQQIARHNGRPEPSPATMKQRTEEPRTKFQIVACFGSGISVLGICPHVSGIRIPS